MSVNSELSALLTKMGGTPLESDSNSDLIKKISSAYEGGGSSGGVLVCHLIMDSNSMTLDKTAGEIFSAAMEGKPIAVINTDGTSGVSYIANQVSHGEDGYTIKAAFSEFVADNANEYPTTGDGK